MALTLVLLLGCGVHDQTGMDLPPKAGSDAKAGNGSANGGRSASAGGDGSSAGASGSASSGAGRGSAGKAGGAGEGAGSGASDAGAPADAAVPGEPTPQDPECDLNGIWIARLTTFSRDDVFNSVQTASNWFYYEIEHDGADFTVTKAFDCGIQVSGSADVTLNSATTAALLTKNDQTGRAGTFVKDGDHCAFAIERWYSVRGVPRATYLAGDLEDDPELSSLTPALPSEAALDGNEDWDGDGSPGIAFNVGGLGTRHVAQRDWNEFFSDEQRAPGLSSDEFVVSARFDSQESLLATSGTLGGLLRAGATPITDGEHRISFRRLGRSASDAAVTALLGAEDVDTCFNVQEALPHDPASM